MPGFPLAAIGAGLGQWSENARRQQEQQIRNQYMQMALNQQRRQQMAKQLEGIALAAGGIPGFGNVGGGGAGINPIGGQGGGVGVPIPQANPQSPAMPLVPGPASVISPAAPPAPGPAAADIADNPFYKNGQYQPDLDTGIAGPQSVPDQGPAVVDLDTPAPTAPPPAPSAGAPPPASPAAQPQQDKAFEPVGETKDGRVIFDVPNLGKMDLTSMFRQVDPTAIAMRIKELRPDAPPDAIAMATESLYKLANSGSKTEQLQIATLLRYLNATRSQDIRVSEGAANRGVRTSEGAANRDVRLRGQDIGSADRAANRDVRTRGQDITSADRAAGRDVTMRGQDIRQDTATANRDLRREQFGQRQSDLKAKQALAQATGQTKMQLGTLERQMADIVRRQNLIINGPNPSSPANKAAYNQMSKNLDELEQRRDAIAGQLFGSGSRE